MNDLAAPRNSGRILPENQENNQFSEVGLYIKEDDQDWGSAGMNDIQEDPK